MKALVLVAGLLSFVVANSAVQAAQLGDIARKESERRKTVKGSGKTYTNDNLPAVPPPSSAPAPAAAAPSSTPASADAAAPASPAESSAAPEGTTASSGDRKKDEAAWRGKVKAERDALERAKAFSVALQSQINALNTDFVNRDDPAQRDKIAADRTKALAEQERLKKEVEQRTKALAAIQDEARRANVPAAWVR